MRVERQKKKEKKNGWNQNVSGDVLKLSTFLKQSVCEFVIEYY